MAIQVEIADVHLGKVKVIDRDIAGDVHAFPGPLDHLQAFGAGQAGDVQFRAGDAGQFDGV